ncbi:MAG: diguanylate cyclase [Methylococcaceae bacterium]
MFFHCSIIFLLSFTYFVAGWLGLKLPFVGTHITLIWLPTGIAVAALSRWGKPVWLGIYIGAFSVNLFTGSSWLLASTIALGNTLAPLLSVNLLNRFGFHSNFDRQKDVGLLVLAAALGMTISALGGVTNLYLAGEIAINDLSFATLSWWLGDTIGVLLAAPFLMTLNWDNLRHLNRVRRELLLWAILASTIAWFTLVQNYENKGNTLPLAFLTIPLLTWSGLRFGNTGAALAGLGFSSVAAWGTATGKGGFILSDIRLSLFILWAYMATTVLTGFIITALQAERLKIEKELQDNEERLSLASLYNGVGIWDWNLQTQELIWDDSMYALYRIRREDFSGTEEAWRQSLHPDDLEHGDRAVEAALSGEKSFDTEFRVCCPNGEIRHIKAVAKVFRDNQGNPIRMLGTNTDITDRKCLQLELEKQAHTDYLTGISNRRHFMAQAELELNRSIRYDNPISVLMMDVDFFKKINDSYGHKVGDVVLKKLAIVSQKTLREIDQIGRLGGEEFAILLPETNATKAMEAAERLREAIEHTKIPLENGLPLHFTVSIGAASLSSKEDNVDVLLNLADQALYKAKETGRNKVCLNC